MDMLKIMTLEGPSLDGWDRIAIDIYKPGSAGIVSSSNVERPRHSPVNTLPFNSKGAAFRFEKYLKERIRC